MRQDLSPVALEMSSTHMSITCQLVTLRPNPGKIPLPNEIIQAPVKVETSTMVHEAKWKKWTAPSNNQQPTAIPRSNNRGVVENVLERRCITRSTDYWTTVKRRQEPIHAQGQ